MFTERITIPDQPHSYRNNTNLLMLSHRDASPCNATDVCSPHIVGAHRVQGSPANPAFLLPLSRIPLHPHSPNFSLAASKKKKKKTALASVAAKLTRSHNRHTENRTRAAGREGTHTERATEECVGGVENKNGGLQPPGASGAVGKWRNIARGGGPVSPNPSDVTRLGSFFLFF